MTPTTRKTHTTPGTTVSAHGLLERTVGRITPQDKSLRQQATARIEQLTMPHWALGRLLDLAVDLAGMTRQMHPPVQRKAIVTMAGDHGVAAAGVSKYPQAVTVQMVHNFVHGGAGINAVARCCGARVVVVDMGVAGDLSALGERIVHRRVAAGTANLVDGPAMSPAQALQSLTNGISLAEELAADCDVIGTGDMGIGNTTASAAIGAVLTGRPVTDLTGRGTGLDDAQLAHKIQVIQQALRINQPDRRDGLDVLAKVGGFEIGGLAGLILGAAANRKPVLVDGLISTAGALLAQALCPQCTDYMIASHCGAEPGHRVMLEHLGKKPLLDLGLRLGEGTGSALAMPLVDAAVAVLTQVATFAEAAVSEANQ